MHFSVLVLVEGDVFREDAEAAVEPLLEPHREEYDDEKDELVGEWDWWVVGGRWSGTLSPDDYDPREDPENWVTCDLCGGTGRRPDADKFGSDWIEWSGGCNGCRGKGWTNKWPSERVAHEGDVVPARTLNGGDWPSCIHSVLTPDGTWHGGGWGEGNGLPDDRKRELIAAHPHTTAVIVDCHV